MNNKKRVLVHIDLTENEASDINNWICQKVIDKTDRHVYYAVDGTVIVDEEEAKIKEEIQK